MGTSTTRTILTLAWPVILARSAQAVVGFTDAAMVAQLGEDALAATTTASLNTMALFILPMGVVFIVQSFAAQLAGRGDVAGVRRYAWYALALAAISAALYAGLIPATRPLVDTLGYTAPVRALIADYIMIRLLAAGAVVATEGLGNWYGGLGETRLAMLASVVTMLINVPLNWVLIYGHLGAPALGVEGAAWASVLASWCGFAAIAAFFAVDRGRGALARLHAAREGGGEPVAPAEAQLPVLTDIPIVAGGHPSVRGLLAEFSRMLRFGLPNGLNWFLEFSAFLVFINFIFAGLGTTAVAALMAVFQLNSIAFMPAFGLTTAGAILVGQAIGGGHYDRVPRLVAHTARLAICWQALIGLIYVALPGPLMSLFASEDAPAAAVVELGAVLLMISAAWQIFDAIAMTLSEALRAAGDTTWCLGARIALAWLVWLPLAHLVVNIADGGAVGATWVMVVYFVCLTLVFGWRFRGGAWRRIDLTGGGEPR
ncbi:MAG: MATE family efflux transporter [Nannocystis sp.]|nr:MATE family efflux transporter [Nannocystis sp.]